MRIERTRRAHLTSATCILALNIIIKQRRGAEKANKVRQVELERRLANLENAFKKRRLFELAGKRDARVRFLCLIRLARREQCATRAFSNGFAARAHAVLMGAQLDVLKVFIAFSTVSLYKIKFSCLGCPQSVLFFTHEAQVRQYLYICRIAQQCLRRCPLFNCL